MAQRLPASDLAQLLPRPDQPFAHPGEQHATGCTVDRGPRRAQRFPQRIHQFRHYLARNPTLIDRGRTEDIDSEQHRAALAF